MAKLTAGARKALPASTFAGPGRSYPIPDRGHAIAAKSDASKAVAAGRMPKTQQSAIDAKANRMLHPTAKALGLGPTSVLPPIA